MIAAWDIETIPNPDMIPLLPEPKVKRGQTEETAKAEQISKMGLDPLYARIICMSFVASERRTTRIIDELTDAAEIDLLQWCAGVIGTDDFRLATWNGIEFDAPFFYKRCLCLDVNPSTFGAPPLTAWTKRYNNDKHIDLMKVFGGWGPRGFVKLDTVAGILLGEHKDEIDFEDFPELMKTKEGRDKIATYCEKDTALTYSLLERMQGVLFV